MGAVGFGPQSLRQTTIASLRHGTSIRRALYATMWPRLEVLLGRQGLLSRKHHLSDLASLALNDVNSLSLDLTGRQIESKFSLALRTLGYVFFDCLSLVCRDSAIDIPN